MNQTQASTPTNYSSDTMMDKLHCSVLRIIIFPDCKYLLVKKMEAQTSSAPISVILSMLGGIFIISGGLMMFAMLSWYGTTIMMGTMAHVHVHISSMVDCSCGKHIHFGRRTGYVCVL
jgi:hypothetical protein